MEWMATNPCGTCDGEGTVGGIGGRLIECGECLGDGGISQRVATSAEGPLIVLVNRCEDGQYRVKLMFGPGVSLSQQFVGRYYPIAATGGGVAYPDAAADDLPSAQQLAEDAVNVMLVRGAEGAAV